MNVLVVTILSIAVSISAQTGMVPVKVLEYPGTHFNFLKPDTIQSDFLFMIGDHEYLRIVRPDLEKNTLTEVLRKEIPFGIACLGYRRVGDTIVTYGRHKSLADFNRYWSHYQYIYPDSLKLLFTIHGEGEPIDVYYRWQLYDSTSTDPALIDSAYLAANPWLKHWKAEALPHESNLNKYISGVDSIIIWKTSAILWQELRDPTGTASIPKVQNRMPILERYDAIGRTPTNPDRAFFPLMSKSLENQY
jgi:hypothetical protein